MCSKTNNKLADLNNKGQIGFQVKERKVIYVAISATKNKV